MRTGRPSLHHEVPVIDLPRRIEREVSCDAHHDEIGASCLACQIVGERQYRHPWAPFETVGTVLQHRPEFRLGSFELPVDRLAILLEQDGRNGQLATDDLKGPAGRNTDDAGMEAFGEITNNLQQGRIRLAELQGHHQGGVGHVSAPKDGVRLARRHQHSSATQPARAKRRQRLVGIGQGEALDLRPHRHLRRNAQEFLGIAPRQVGHRHDLRSPHRMS